MHEFCGFKIQKKHSTRLPSYTTQLISNMRYLIKKWKRNSKFHKPYREVSTTKNESTKLSLHLHEFIITSPAFWPFLCRFCFNPFSVSKKGHIQQFHSGSVGNQKSIHTTIIRITNQITFLFFHQTCCKTQIQ